MSYFPALVRRYALAEATATSVPNRRAIVEQVDQQFPHLLRHNDKAANAEFTQRVLAELAAKFPGERWGHLSKTAGEGGGITMPNSVRISHDVIARPDGNRVDIVSGGDNHPAPGGATWNSIAEFDEQGNPQWRPANVYLPAFPTIFDSHTPGAGQPATVAELGHGWFCLLRDFQDHASDIQPNAAFIREHLAPKVWRVFLDVEGISHIQGNNPDPWRDAGIDGRASNWSDLFKKALDWAGEADEQLWCCVYGGRNHFPESHSRRAFHDRIMQAAEGRWAAIYGLECMNEYIVNKWTDAEVRDAGIDLRSKVPVGTRIALSSPRYAHSYVEDGGNGHEASNEEMAACIEQLYGGTGHSGASVMTIHKMRDPRSKWADMFSYNPFAHDLPKIDGEPFGDGASAGGDTSDPALIAADYQRSSNAGAILYVAHPATWCIWRNNLPREYPHRLYRWIKDVPHIEETFRLLRAVREGGTIEPGQPGVPDVPPQPYPDEPTFWNHATEEIKKRYPGGQLNDEAFRWFARTAYDIGAGTKAEDALKKHLAELDAIVAPKPAA